MDDLNLNVLKNIVRTGWVSSVNVEERTARVIFEDKGETIVSGELKVLKNPPWIPEYYAPYRTEYEAGGSGYPQFESHKHDLILRSVRGVIFGNPRRVFKHFQRAGNERVALVLKGNAGGPFRNIHGRNPARSNNIL